jgi:hypothetical protein
MKDAQDAMRLLDQRKPGEPQEVPVMQDRSRTSTGVCNYLRRYLGKGTEYLAALQRVIVNDARLFKDVAENVFWDPRNALQMLPDPLKSSLAVAFVELARPCHQFCYQDRLFLMMVALRLRCVHRQLQTELAAEVA